MRVAFALSAAWMVLASCFANGWAVRRAAKLTNAQIDACLVAYARVFQAQGDAWTPCWEDFDKRFLHNVSTHWLIAGTAALLPVLSAWLCAYAYSRNKRRISTARRADGNL